MEQSGLARWQQATEKGVSTRVETTGLTISQALAYFAASLPPSSNYPRIVRGYLRYCVEKGYGIDAISVGMYTIGRKPNLVSPVRKFFRFAQQNGINRVVADVEKKATTPAANEYILAFLKDNKRLRGEESKASYQKGLNAFFHYIDAQQVVFNGTVVNEYVIHLREGGYSAFTINLYLSAIRQFSRWLLKNRDKMNLSLQSSQIEALRDVELVESLPIEKKFYKDSLSEGERNRLMDSIPVPRDKAILALMVYSGLRTVEVTRLQRGGVELSKGIIYVLGKGKATRRAIKLFQTAAQCLELYLGTLATPLLDQEALFTDLTRAHIRYITDKYLRGAGLKKKGISAHSLRHTAGQIMLTKGIAPIYVQQQLRHQSFDTTQYYVKKQIEKDFLGSLPDNL